MNFDRYPSRCAPRPSTAVQIHLLHADGNRPSKALCAGRRPSPTQKTILRSAQADRGPKAFVPIEIGPSRRCTPSVGLRRRKRHLPGRRRPTAGRRPPQAAFIRRAGRPPAEGLRADWNRSLQALHAKRRPSPTQKTPSRSAQADRRPKAPPGRIHSACRPTAGRRPSCRL